MLFSFCLFLEIVDRLAANFAKDQTPLHRPGEQAILPRPPVSPHRTTGFFSACICINASFYVPIQVCCLTLVRTVQPLQTIYAFPAFAFSSSLFLTTVKSLISIG